MLNDGVIYRAEKGDTIKRDSYAAEAQGFYAYSKGLEVFPLVKIDLRKT